MCLAVLETAGQIKALSLIAQRPIQRRTTIKTFEINWFSVRSFEGNHVPVAIEKNDSRHLIIGVQKDVLGERHGPLIGRDDRLLEIIRWFIDVHDKAVSVGKGHANRLAAGFALAASTAALGLALSLAAALWL